MIECPVRVCLNAESDGDIEIFAVDYHPLIDLGQFLPESASNPIVCIENQHVCFWHHQCSRNLFISAYLFDTNHSR